MDLDDYPSPQRSTPWRLSHMMYLVAGVAVILWLVVLVYDSILLVFFIMAGIVFSFASVMGAGVIRRGGDRPGRIRSCGCWRSPRSMRCR